MPKILVIGSNNIDLMFKVKFMPKIDQTVLSDSFTQNAGGKGFNQVVACKQFGLDSILISKIGNDIYGEVIKTELEKFKIITSSTLIAPNKKTGVASIYYDKNGDKEIVVLPGANYDLLPSDIKDKDQLIKECEIIVLQLEIPLITIEFALERAKTLAKKTVLNASPGRKLTKKILENTDYLFINSSDLETIANIKGSTSEMILKISSNFVGYLIVKDIYKGYYLAQNNNVQFLKSNFELSKNSVLDDDIFVASFVYCLTKDMEIVSAIIAASKVSQKFLKENLNFEDLGEHLF